MKRRDFLRGSFGALITAGFASQSLATFNKSKKPNVLFIAVDDMNDWTADLKGYKAKAHTPNQQRLAAMGTKFNNAHTANPICCPSRAAVMTGLKPSTSGVYNNGQWFYPAMPEHRTIPLYFRYHGYGTFGAGKIFHHTAGNNPPLQWDKFHRLVFNDDPWFRGVKLNYPWSNVTGYPEGYPFCGIKNIPHECDWGVLDKEETDYDDARSVNFACDILKQKHDKPFFLACGTFRPHLPWYVPQKYVDMYPLEDIQLPIVPDDDMDDIPPQGQKLSKTRRADFERIKKAGKWQEAIQHYLASITFADAQVGRLLDTLQASDYADNTVVVFWSDHGWHLGEKNHWHKMTLWEEATRVPFYICAPGIANGQFDGPVSLLDIYPTLIDLCGLKDKSDLDGESLVPFMKNNKAKKKTPAVIQYQPGQCAIRSQRWRYICYSDKTEELYDHNNDSNEWHNLANDKKYAKVKEELKRWLPKEWAKGVPSKGAYKFDHVSYSWTDKKTGKVISGLK
ncbi:MAG: sulfatase [Phycisphaerae bacterium]|nr:sulfatase [Phycisphaerae bacterium]